MSDHVLIHGYAIELETWFRRKKDHRAGFAVFTDEIDAGDTKVFRWSAPLALTPLTSLNPLVYIQHYFLERTIAENETTLTGLHNLLTNEQPTSIICHSMGCYLFLNYLRHFTLPKSVKQVFFLQADCTQQELESSGLLELPIEFIQIFRSIDPSLWGSSLLHHNVRLGLKKVLHPHVRNIYFPSLKHWNLHTAVLEDPSWKEALQLSQKLD